MKVKTEVLIGFLKKTTMTGVSALSEGVLDFTDKGIKISSQSANNNVLISAILKSKVIEDYKAVGKVGVHNLQDVVKLLDGFIGEYIKFEIKNNQILFSSARRKVKVTLMDKDVVAKPTEYPKSLDERSEITISMDILKGFFKNMGMVNTSEFTFTIKGKELYFCTKGFNEVTEKISIEQDIKDIRLSLSKAFIDAVENLTDDVTLQLKTDYPITVVSKNKNYAIRILVAPIVQETK